MPSVPGGLKMTLANLSRASLKGYTRKGALKDLNFRNFLLVHSGLCSTLAILSTLVRRGVIQKTGDFLV